MINIAPGKEKDMSAARTRVIENFIEKCLTSFNARKLFMPVTEPESGDRIVEWRFFINHFFFIERGREKSSADARDYLALMRREGNAEIELGRGESGENGTWNFPPGSLNAGVSLSTSIERTDAAAISRMISYLFTSGYIVADTEDWEIQPDENSTEAEELTVIG